MVTMEMLGSYSFGVDMANKQPGKFMSSAQFISSSDTNQPNEKDVLTKEQIKKNQDEFMRADPKMDRKIIEGMLADPDALIKKLGDMGIKQAMVLQRAADCGISESILRQMKRVAADLAGDKATVGFWLKSRLSNGVRARQCLACDRVFLSTGPGNRLCSRCRGGDAGLAQL